MLYEVITEETVSEFIQSLKGLMLDGVMHEFRNIFSIVTGYTEMLIDGFGEGDSVIVSEVREEYSEIIKGCKRGKELLDKVTLMTRSVITSYSIHYTKLYDENEWPFSRKILRG